MVKLSVKVVDFPLEDQLSIIIILCLNDSDNGKNRALVILHHSLKNLQISQIKIINLIYWLIHQEWTDPSNSHDSSRLFRESPQLHTTYSTGEAAALVALLYTAPCIDNTDRHCSCYRGTFVWPCFYTSHWHIRMLRMWRTPINALTSMHCVSEETATVG